MIKASHNIVLVKNQKDIKKGYLKLRTIQNRKVKDKSLSIQIQHKNWNSSKQLVNKKEPNYKTINEMLAEIKKEVSAGNSNILNDGDKSLINFADKVVNAITNTSTRMSKGNALNKFKDYLKLQGVDDIKFEQIDTFFVQNYYKYLLGDIAISSANVYLTSLKYFVNLGVKNKKHKYDPDPFSTVIKSKVTKKYKVITNDELNKFMGYDNFNTKRKNVFEGFLFMMHAGGVRISNTLLMRFENIEQHNNQLYLNYRLKKTGIQLQTKLTLSAIMHLSHFLIPYDAKCKTLLNDYYDIKKILDAEHDSIKIPNTQKSLFMSLQLMMYEAGGGEENDLTHKELIRREYFKAKDVNNKQERLKAIKAEINQHKLELSKQIGVILMGLKDLYPQNTLLPYMNDIYDGQHILTEKQETTLKKFKVHFNDQLITITHHLGLKTRITPHMARHVFAQRLFLSGVSMHYISMALGHSTMKVTEAYRQQLITEESMSVIDVFEDILLG